MVWQYVAVAGAGLLAAHLFGESEKDHHEVVEDTYDALDAELPSDGAAYADHLDHREDVENTEGVVDGLHHIPDVVVKAGSANSLIVEVETADSLAESPDDAKSQLQDFSKSGYRRVLVVPEGKSDVEAVKEFLADIEDGVDGKIHLATPDTVTKLL